MGGPGIIVFFFEVEPDNTTFWKRNNLLKTMCGTFSDDIVVTHEGRGIDLVFHSDMSVSAPGYLANVFVTPVKESKMYLNVVLVPTFSQKADGIDHTHCRMSL